MKIIDKDFLNEVSEQAKTSPDVWEHAYYLDSQNRRAAHLAALWQIVDWNMISARYGASEG